MENILDSQDGAELISDNSLRSRTVYYLTLTSAFLGLISVVSDLMQYSLLIKASSGVPVTTEVAEMNDLRQRILALGWIGLRIATFIFFIMWFRRAYNNLHKIGVSPLRFSEGWAAGAWFVPIVNIGRPFIIMKEICLNTVECVRGNNPEFEAASPVKLVGWWWALEISGSIMGRIEASTTANAKTVELLMDSTVISMISSGVNILSDVFCILIVRKLFLYEGELFRKQVEIHAKLQPVQS